MATESTIQVIEKYVDRVLEAEPEYFRVNVKIKPTNNVKVFIDGDNGVTIEKCVRFNRSLYKIMEESTLFPDGDKTGSWIFGVSTFDSPVARL